MEEVAVGIDLGTTNSCVAAIQNGRPKIIEDERGYNILPSCVAFKSHGKFVVGHGAKALILTNPTQTVYAVKRLIGRKFSSVEVQEARRRLSYEIFEGEGDEAILRLGDVELTPEEISSIVLKCIREVAERALGCPVQQAVITVPAYFNHAQRRATLQAAELAGLDCLRLINEPTAAALAYGFKKDLDKRVAIYDLGGGTFDLSVLEIGGGVYETLGTSGNTFLGGEDFDYRVVDYLADQFRQQHGVDLREDKMSLQRLKDAAERAKCELSFVDRTPILIPRVHESLNLEMTLDRTTLEGLVDDLIKETVRITSEALSDADVSLEELDEIILVGGMTRMPKVQEAIRVFFGMAPCKGVHPEEVVATGASVQAFSLEEEAESHILLDVTPFSLGIDTAGGFFSRIIDRNTTLPVTLGRTFTTVTDNQDVVKVVVRQGESEVANDNEFLGEFSLEGIRQAARMTPRIDVDFKIDANGILHVTAADRDTGEAQTVSIKDYQEKVASGTATDVQLAVGEPEGGGAAPAAAAAAAAGGGLFGKLKTLFGKGDEGAGDGPSQPDTDVQDRSGAPDAGPQLDVQDRGGAEPVHTDNQMDVQDRGMSMAPPEDPGHELTDRDAFSIPDQPPPMEGQSMAQPGDEIADNLKNSLGGMFGEPTGSGPAVAQGDAIQPAAPAAPEDPYGIAPAEGAAQPAAEPFGITPVVQTPLGGEPPQPAAPEEPYGIAPLGGDPGGAPASPAPSAPATGDSLMPLPDARPHVDTRDRTDLGVQAQQQEPAEADPFAIRERPQLDPFGVSGGGGTDPFMGQEGESAKADPFALSDTTRSKRTRRVDTQLQTKPGITPAAFNLAENPEAVAASRKRPARLKIRYKRSATFVKEFTENLARGGTFVKTKSPLEVGRRCVFELSVKDLTDTLALKGMVVWSSRGIDKLDADQEPGMGIQYDTEDAEGLESVRAAVQELA